MSAANGDADMIDTPGDLARWPALAGPLETCAREVLPHFRAADAAAEDHQRWHRLWTALAVLFGTAAVLYLIESQVFPDLIDRELLPTFEAAAAAAALAAVVLGIVSGRQENWIVERYRAERLRQAKFRFLIDPSLWGGDGAAASARAGRLREEVGAILRVGRADLEREVEKEAPQDAVPLPGQAEAIPAETLGQLVDYYRAKRLLFQLAFFRGRVERFERLDRVTRHPVPWLFFGSVFCALAHFARHYLGNLLHGRPLLASEGEPDTASLVLIFFALALPTLGGGVRTLRSAYEFARNTSRYRAKVFALTSLDQLLVKDVEPWAKLRKLWYCEENLEFEIREWSRLMIEAEWFG